MLIESRSHALLYDSGPRFAGTAGADSRIVLPYMRWRGINGIDLLVVSHLDKDHLGGTWSILRGTRVAGVLSSIDPSHPSLLGASDARRCAAGQRFEIDPLQVDVLRPPAADYAQPRLPTNAASCVLRIGLGRHRLLLAGGLPARRRGNGG